MKWHLTDRLNTTVVIEAATAEEAVLANVGPREYEHVASQPDPELHPEWWQLHFTRPGVDGVPHPFVASFTVYAEKKRRGRP